MSKSSFYIQRGEKTSGPFDLSHVRKLHAAEKLRPSDLIAQKSDGPWHKLADVESKLIATSTRTPQTPPEPPQAAVSNEAYPIQNRKPLSPSARKALVILGLTLLLSGYAFYAYSLNNSFEDSTVANTVTLISGLTFMGCLAVGGLALLAIPLQFFADIRDKEGLASAPLRIYGKTYLLRSFQLGIISLFILVFNFALFPPPRSSSPSQSASTNPSSAENKDRGNRRYLSDVDKIILAKQIVKNSANYPDTVSFHFMHTKVSGNHVTLKWTWKNAFGVPETQTREIRID